MQSDENMPNWDIAIAGMVEEAQGKKSVPLIMDDFRELAREYDFRLDDIMETVLLMVMHEKWIYHPSSNDAKVLNHETLVEYCIKKRLSEDDLKVFLGGWAPNPGLQAV